MLLPPVAPCWRSPMWRSQAEAEGLTLLEADNKTGYFGVYLKHPGCPNPYEARVWRGGNKVHLGSFATADEAALCVARTPEGQEAATRPAAPPLPRRQAGSGGGRAHSCTRQPAPRRRRPSSGSGRRRRRRSRPGCRRGPQLLRNISRLELLRRVARLRRARASQPAWWTRRHEGGRAVLCVRPFS